VTPHQQAEQAETFHACGGSYEVSGNVIIFHTDISRNPSNVGVDAEYEYDVDGDQIRLTAINLDSSTLSVSRSGEVVLKKVH